MGQINIGGIIPIYPKKRYSISKFFQLTVVGVYVILSAYCTIHVVKLWGIAISGHLTVLLLTGWVLCFFWAICYRPAIIVSKLQVRRPVIQEELWLQDQLQQVLDRAGLKKKIEILIQEELAPNALSSGFRTIIVSTGLLRTVRSEEFRAILAHELGHLQSRDSLPATVLATARWPFGIIWKVYATIWNTTAMGVAPILFRGSLLVRGLIAVLFAALLYWAYSNNLLSRIISTWVFICMLPWIDRVLIYCWNTVDRFIEYKQDEYAFNLGYGTALRFFLNAVALENPQPVSVYDTLRRSSHPMIYNRIRRLERLEGLR